MRTKLPFIMSYHQLRSEYVDLVMSEFPGRMQLLLRPEAAMSPEIMRSPFVLDNGRYATWARGRKWKASLFWKMIDRYRDHPPRWLAVPDFVGDAKRTYDEWEKWVPKLTPLKWRLALIVQEGMTITDINKLSRRPDVIFVGGATQKWKWNNMRHWVHNFPEVHVGRVNRYEYLWSVQESGAASCDGTGWWRFKNFRRLLRYFRRSQSNMGRSNIRGFF